jgi:hypothetical protein
MMPRSIGSNGQRLLRTKAATGGEHSAALTKRRVRKVSALG